MHFSEIASHVSLKNEQFQQCRTNDVLLMDSTNVSMNGLLRRFVLDRCRACKNKTNRAEQVTCDVSWSSRGTSKGIATRRTPNRWNWEKNGWTDTTDVFLDIEERRSRRTLRVITPCRLVFYIGYVLRSLRMDLNYINRSKLERADFRISGASRVFLRKNRRGLVGVRWTNREDRRGHTVLVGAFGLLDRPDNTVLSNVKTPIPSAHVVPHTCFTAFNRWKSDPSRQQSPVLRFPLA